MVLRSQMKCSWEQLDSFQKITDSGLTTPHGDSADIQRLVSQDNARNTYIVVATQVLSDH